VEKIIGKFLLSENICPKLQNLGLKAIIFGKILGQN